MSTDGFVEQVRDSNDIIEVVSQYVRLEQQGKNFVGLCPFHQEDTPSFTVSPTQQLYYCFGCQAGGDIFNFIMEIEGLEFREALEFLAERAGLDMPSDSQSSESQRRRSQRARVRKYLIKLGDFVCKFYQQKLEQNRPAAKYLKERKVPREVQKDYRLGWAPDSWDALCGYLEKHGANLKAAKMMGVVNKSKKTDNYYDVFRGRIIFPITDPRGNVVGFGGRVIDSNAEPKYLNTPDSPLFKKRQVWYGLEQARSRIRKRNRAIIVEGYIDVLACSAHGWQETVASMGTSLTAEHAQLLARYTDNVYVAYDADAAGSDAAVRSLNQFTGTSIALKVVDLPEDKDPDDVLNEEGKDIFNKHLEQAKSFFQFCWERSLKRRDRSAAEGKAHIIRDMAPLIWAEEDEVVRADRIRFMAQSLRVDEKAVRKQLSKLQKVEQKHKPDRDRHNIKENYGIKYLPDNNLGQWRAERQLIKLMFYTQRFLQRARESLNPEDFENSVHQSFAEAVLNSNCQDIDRLRSEVLSDCDKEEIRRIFSEILMEEEIPDNSVDKVFSDCMELLICRRKMRRIEELDNIIARHDQEGEKVPRKILREQAELIRELKKSRFRSF